MGRHLFHKLFRRAEGLNLQPDDEFHDIFLGSGAVTAAWEKWRRQFEEPEQFELEHSA